MRRATADTETNASRKLMLQRCEELVRFAIDRLSIEDTSWLTPHDRARLASATELLNDIRERLERTH